MYLASSVGFLSYLIFECVRCALYNPVWCTILWISSFALIDLFVGFQPPWQLTEVFFCSFFSCCEATCRSHRASCRHGGGSLRLSSPRSFVNCADVLERSSLFELLPPSDLHPFPGWHSQVPAVNLQNSAIFCGSIGSLGSEVRS